MAFKRLLTKEFKITKYDTFIRQLYLYGFKAVKGERLKSFKRFFFEKNNCKDLFRIKRKIKAKREQKVTERENQKLKSRVAFLKRMLQKEREEGRMREGRREIEWKKKEGEFEMVKMKCEWYRDFVLNIIHNGLGNSSN